MIRKFVALSGTAVLLGSLSALGCTVSGVGDPCTPESEYKPDFPGFSQKEVNVESGSFQCQTRVCLVNHFQGRTTCPYGSTDKPCKIPGTAEGSAPVSVPVAPSCVNRNAAKSVYCSCRCADVAGRTDDGANYCKCGDGFTCTQLVTAIETAERGLTGAYCIKAGTTYSDTDDSCLKCDSTKNDCGSVTGR